jgi:PPOX class probable F420-dependent enzyme
LTTSVNPKKEENTIPESHADLLRNTVDVVLTTISPDGYPQSTLVWCSLDGSNVLMNTGKGYQKERNLRRNSHIAVFAFDPNDHLHCVEIQGDAELIEEGAIEHLNLLSKSYTGKADFYRDVMPELAGKETRVIIRLKPKKVRVRDGPMAQKPINKHPE